VDELKDYKPQKDAVMRFSVFMEVFHKWVIDVYHQSPNSRETNIPSVSWDQGVKSFPPIIYQDDVAERLIIEFGQTLHPMLRQRGVVFLDLWYSNENLTAYRKANPPPAGSKNLKMVVKVNPSDLSYVYVYLDADQRYIKAPCVDPEGYTQGLTLFQHQTNRRFLRAFHRSQVNTEMLAEARLYIDQRIESEIEEVKRSGKRKQKQIKGVKTVAKHRNVGSDAASSIVKTPNNNALGNTRDAGGDESVKSAAKDLINNWDDIASDLDAY
jgi:putative transposase